MSNQKAEDKSEIHTIEEQLVLEEIRLLALQVESLMLDCALRHGLLPDSETVMKRITSRAWSNATKEVPR